MPSNVMFTSGTASLGLQTLGQNLALLCAMDFIILGIFGMDCLIFVVPVPVR